MSRIGNRILNLPSEVTLTVNDNLVTVTGPKGTLSTEINKDITVEVNNNEVIIKKQELQKPTEILTGHNDHRIVMSLSVLLTLTGGYIQDEDAVKKSYPRFFEDLKQIGIEVRQC